MKPQSIKKTLSPQALQSKMQVPPDLQNAYERVVVAGMKVMFSKQTHGIMLKEIQTPGPVPERLGKGVAGLMLTLFMQSNKTMPPQVIIPAGVYLLAQAADFVEQTGLMQVSDKDIGDGIEVMISIILEKFGAQPGQIEQMLSQYDNSNLPTAPTGGAA